METILFVIKKVIPQPIFRALQPIYHYKLSFLAALFYFFPSRKLTVIGVTGTDGKSSVVSILHEIFFKSGVSVASVSSLRFKVNDSDVPNLLKMTMPGRFFIQKFLRNAARQAVKVVVLEVTSEGIKQFRHKFINFSGAVLTNVTPEHIESHGSFEKYRATKAKLFRTLGKKSIAVLNRDDPSWSFFVKAGGAKAIFYSKRSVVMGHNKEHEISNLVWAKEIRFGLADTDFYSPLFGEFNVSNILAAVVTANAFGVPFQKIAEALKNIRGIPGRLEVLQESPFRVVVDYAHTPNALESAYKALKDATPGLRLICVLGSAGGGRDKWKRPELGKIAGEFCAEVILTNEDPYDEPPHEIIDQVAIGAGAGVKKVLDRREAINEAFKLARARDTVIITGKGAEQWIMGPRNTRIPWDDRKVVMEGLEKIYKK